MAFREYRPATVARRIRNRMVAAGVPTAGPGPPRARRLDLVGCRNLLVYFAPALQARVLARLCGALAPAGLLWPGEAEWPTGHEAERLRVVDRSARLFALAGEGRLA